MTLKNVRLAAGLAQLQLDGTLFPTSTVGGKAVEMVFLGKGRVTLEPPDDIEAGQLSCSPARAVWTPSSRRPPWSSASTLRSTPCCARPRPSPMP